VKKTDDLFALQPAFSKRRSRTWVTVFDRVKLPLASEDGNFHPIDFGGLAAALKFCCGLPMEKTELKPASDASLSCPIATLSPWRQAQAEPRVLTVSPDLAAKAPAWLAHVAVRG
jgi:hypothetical protein